MRFESEVVVDHAELVGEAAGTPSLVLTGAEIHSLLRLQADASGLVPEDVERFLLGRGDELGSGSGSGLLGPWDLCRLVEGDVACLQGAADLVRVAQAFGGLDRLLGFADRCPGHASKLGGVVEPAGERGLAE